MTAESAPSRRGRTATTRERAVVALLVSAARGQFRQEVSSDSGPDFSDYTWFGRNQRTVIVPQSKPDNCNVGPVPTVDEPLGANDTATPDCII